MCSIIPSNFIILKTPNKRTNRYISGFVTIYSYNGFGFYILSVARKLFYNGFFFYKQI